MIFLSAVRTRKNISIQKKGTENKITKRWLCVENITFIGKMEHLWSIIEPPWATSKLNVMFYMIQRIPLLIVLFL